MRRNSLRIVCDSYHRQISYYFRNESGVWTEVCSDSPLSRLYYTNTTMQDRAKEIAEKMDAIYNRKNKGLDIFFEGENQSLAYLQGAIRAYLPDRDIVCTPGVTKIAVAGKIQAGKTSLIEGLEQAFGHPYTKHTFPDYAMYEDDANHAQWYEIKGIDLGMDHVEKAYKTISTLAEQGLSAVVYCVAAVTGRMEDAERDLILRLMDAYPKVTMLVALTISIKKDVRSFVNEIKQMAEQIKVIPTLAKEYELEIQNPKTGEEESVFVKPYGLDILSKYVFERR